jgi:hypothetical protein
VTFSRCLCIPVGSVPVVIESEMLPVLSASKTQHGSVVVVVVCSVGHSSGMWSGVVLRICATLLFVQCHISLPFPQVGYGVRFWAVPALVCRDNRILWSLSCVVTLSCITLNHSDHNFLVRVRSAGSSTPLSNLCQVAGVRSVCPNFLIPFSSWCASWCTVGACWCVGLQSGHVGSHTHTLCGYSIGSEEPQGFLPCVAG